MVRWHHPLDGCEFEQALGLVMNRESWHVQSMASHESDMTELN